MANLTLPASSEFPAERTLTNEHDVCKAFLYDETARAQVHSFNPDEVFVTKEGHEWYCPRPSLRNTDRLKFTFVAVPAVQVREGVRLYVHGTQVRYYVDNRYEMVGGLAVFCTCFLPQECAEPFWG